MAYDKLIDSAKFDAAVTATADAIRAKNGSTDKITWDESGGFTNAVAAIPQAKVVSGTFTPLNWGVDNPLEVTGLGFKPSIVMFFYSLGLSTLARDMSPGCIVYGVAGFVDPASTLGSGEYAPFCLVEEEVTDTYYDEDLGEDVEYSYWQHKRYTSPQFEMTMTDDGFTIEKSSADNVSLSHGVEYGYIAIS